MKLPLVSIVIPTCRRPLFLKRAIESVYAQTYPNIEVIVVDDNGKNTDQQVATEALLSDYVSRNDFHYLPLEKNFGQVVARNRGIALTRGDYIGFLDDDDEFLPEKIERQVTRLTQLDDSFGACYCLQYFFWGNHDHLDSYIAQEGDLTEAILTFQNHMNTSALLFKREVLLSLGGFNEQMRYDEDWELVLHLFDIGYKIALADPDKALLRRYDTGISFAKRGQEVIKTRKQSLCFFERYIHRLPNANTIYKIQWQFAYQQLFHQGYKWLGLKAAFFANSYSHLTLLEWKWIIARIIKNQ